MASFFLMIIMMIVATMIGSVGSLFLKKGSKNFHLNFKKGIFSFIKGLIYNWNIILGISLYGFGTIIFIYLLRNEELSVLYPLTSLSYIFVTVLSFYVLKEKMNFYKIFGIVCIIGGVILVTV
jgi:drug/metabolite transporter (DMT)-like permease